MHPNPAFRANSQEAHEALIDAVGFGMIVAPTATGLRAAHVPIARAGSGAVRFHLANANPLTPHLAEAEVLAVINGADGYISPRWYEAPGDVPTWNYEALELTGPVRLLSGEQLADLLAQIGAQHEARLPGGPHWQADTVPQDKWDKLIGMITGFELTVREYRHTRKLSQNKPEATRRAVTEGLAASGNHALARLMLSGSR